MKWIAGGAAAILLSGSLTGTTNASGQFAMTFTSATAGKVQTLTLGNVSFGLSREQRARVEGEAQTQAVERFKAKATDIAKGFGFGGFTLREVSVNANDQGFVPRPRMMAMEARAAVADAPVPVEAGKSTVLVTVLGILKAADAQAVSSDRHEPRLVPSTPIRSNPCDASQPTARRASSTACRSRKSC